MSNVEHHCVAGWVSQSPREGEIIYLAACGALGLVELVLGTPLPELHPIQGMPDLVRIASGGSLVLLTTAALFSATAPAAFAGLSLSWAIALALTANTAVTGPSSLISWVPATKAAIFSLTALVMLIRDRRSTMVLRIAFGTSLVFYGFVHLVDQDVIATLIPAWIPFRLELPILTGALQIVAGLSLVTGICAELFALAIGAMFAGWILLLHSERLAARPLSPFEWTFALSALGLLGVSLSVAQTARSRTIAGRLPF